MRRTMPAVLKSKTRIEETKKLLKDCRAPSSPGRMKRPKSPTDRGSQ